MITSKIKAILHQARSMLKRDPDRFLRKVSGVIHVGANAGQERELYAKFGLRVIWIEPIPEVFEKLKMNVAKFSPAACAQMSCYRSRQCGVPVPYMQQ